MARSSTDCPRRPMITDTATEHSEQPAGPNSFTQPGMTPRVFISYARADGERIAREVRRRLIAGPPALSVWQDRSELEGGVGWWKQITEALDVVDFLVLLITPAALSSDVVQREWRYARQQGVCVYPVFSPALPIDFTALPRWMRKAHFFDLASEWDTLVAHLARPAAVKRVPFMAPDLLPGFVARPEVMQPLRRALLAAMGEQVAITTALQGAGGLGKTTLAIALCHDEDVIEAFDDGIIWVTLGNEPKVMDELAKVYVALTGRRPAFVDRDDAAYHLGQALEERNCLIVIDDVWHAAHLKPFLRGGRGCVRLITTRLADIAPDATRFAVDAMNLAQATELLAKGLQVSPRERTSLRQLAARLGEWPLLLDLANAQLRRRVLKGDTLAGAIAHADQRFEREGVSL
jgi:NB-ARC domain-containing protein/TIR domain-containing protein